MNIVKLNEKIIEWLSEFEVKDLPNLPNLNGVFDQTDISFAIVSGQKSNTSDYITIKLNISIAATLRTTKESTAIQTEQKNLYELMSAVIYKLQKKKIEAGGLMRLDSFENFTPESGKWRSLLSFEVDLPINSEVDANDNCILGF